MKPIGRTTFVLTTVAALASYGGAVWLIEVFSHRIEGLFGLSTLRHQMIAVLAMLGLVVVGAGGAWTYMLARRHVTFGEAVWPSLLPLGFSLSCGLVLMAGVALWDPDPFATMLSIPETEKLSPEEMARRRAEWLRQVEINALLLKIARIGTIALFGLSVLTGGYLTTRALRRDPVPVADHFS